MQLQAPAITEFRPAGLDTAKLAIWLRGIGVRQVRIACGLVMFSYIFSHFFNHALGNISYPTMEAWLYFHIWWWRIPVVNAALYAAAATHFSLGLWALYQRRHFRYTAAEIIQLILGLSIPLLLASHFGAQRVTGWLFGRDPSNYATPLLGYWANRPYMIAVQFVLLTVAWTHACIGLYFWLRMKPFFKWASPIFFAIAVLLPPLAMLGAHHGAREVIELAKNPQWRSQNFRPIPAPQRTIVDDITLFYFPIGYAGAIAFVFAARGVRSLRERRRGTFTVSYPNRQVRVPKGLSVLEASLRFKIPMPASAAGARAARLAAFASSATALLCRGPRAVRLLCWRGSARALTHRSVSPVSCGRRPTWPSFRSCRRTSAPSSCATAAASTSAKSVTSSACSSICAAQRG